MHAHTETLPNPDGVPLVRYRWAPSGELRAVIGLLHGYAEHAGRYDGHAAHFTAAGISVESFDYAGHGRSGARRGYIKSYHDLVRDALLFVSRLRDSNPERNLFLVGHSLGGAIAALVAAELGGSLSGLILSSPAIALEEPIWLQKAACFLSSIMPRVGVKPLDLRMLSTDQRIASQFESDELTFCGRVPVGTAAEIIRSGEAAARIAKRINVPLLVLHGTADRITSPDASARFYRSAASSDKSISLFMGMYHETFNEPNGDRVLDHMVGFVLGHLDDSDQPV